MAETCRKCGRPRARRSNYCEEHQFDDDYCPDCHASPHEEGCRVLQLETELKEARAEVLAACQGVVEVFIQEIGKFSQQFARWRPFKKWDRDDWEAAGSRLLCDLSEAMEKVQPAAKDLEEYVKNLPLSEIARIKGLPGLAKLGKTYDRPDFHATEDE